MRQIMQFLYMIVWGTVLLKEDRGKEIDTQTGKKRGIAGENWGCVEVTSW